MTIAVTVTGEGGRTFAVAVDANELSIGRATGNEVSVRFANVSRRHARVVLRDGKLIVVDFKSTNGTYVNGKRISAPQLLKETDTLYIGPLKLHVSMTRPVGAQAPGSEPAWVRGADPTEATQVGLDPPSRSPPRAPTPARLPSTSEDDADEETPVRGVPAPLASPRLSQGRAPGWPTRRTVIDDDEALGGETIPPAIKKPAGMNVRVGAVTLVERLPDEAMLEVWRGTVSSRDARVVRLREERREDSAIVAMFRDASALIGRFTSPRLPRLLAAEPELRATSPAPGVKLAAVLEARGALAPELAVSIARELALALADLHELAPVGEGALRPVLRMVTPGAVEIGRDGAVHLCDFMIARSDAAWREEKTKPGILKGLFTAMAPEQVRGLREDARADLWALGILLREMVTGVNPFRFDSPFETLEAVRNCELPPLEGVPACVRDVLDAVLRRDRDERPASARAVATLLDTCALELPPVTRFDLEQLVRGLGAPR